MRFIVVVILLPFMLCRPSTSKKDQYKKIVIDSNEMLLRLQHVGKDSLIEQVLTLDSLPNGPVRIWKSGILSCIGNYENGLKEGQWKYLDYLGDTLKIENWFSGKKFGEQLEYYGRKTNDSVPKLYRYSFLNLNSEEVFSIAFDMKGIVTHKHGIPIYCAFNKLEFKTQEKFECLIFFGVLPQWSYKLAIEETDISHLNKTKVHVIDSGPNGIISLPYAKKYVLENKYVKSGTYRWDFSLVLSERENVIKDSIQLHVQVD